MRMFSRSPGETKLVKCSIFGSCTEFGGWWAFVCVVGAAERRVREKSTLICDEWKLSVCAGLRPGSWRTSALVSRLTHRWLRHSNSYTRWRTSCFWHTDRKLPVTPSPPSLCHSLSSGGEVRHRSWELLFHSCAEGLRCSRPQHKVKDTVEAPRVH